VDCHAEQILIDPQKALALGIIANELITNAVKHAFKDGAGCTIDVSLDRDTSGLLRLKVRDNGSGCPDAAKPGSGTKLINDLVRAHKGSYTRLNVSGGCEVTVTLAPRTRQSAAA
jgi:two-component sensor histidine kinase